MLEEPREFVFIMLKPAALNDTKLADFIKQELLKYGDIKYVKQSVIVNKSIISEHYKAAKLSLWFPLVVNYLSGKVVQHFILEFNSKKHNLVDNKKYFLQIF
jgi:nucleoside diphosphate kinase